MNCKKAETLLVEYLYQELSARKTLEIEKHLQTCDRCPKTLESWRAIHGGFQNSDYPEASPFLKQKILSAARQELARKPSFLERFSFVIKPAFVLPVMVLGLAALLYLPLQNKESKIAMAPPVDQAVAPMKNSAKKLDSSESEVDRLRSLGYLSDTDQARKLEERNELNRSDVSRDREKVLGDKADGMKQAKEAEGLESQQQNEPSEREESFSVLGERPTSPAPVPEDSIEKPASKAKVQEPKSQYAEQQPAPSTEYKDTAVAQAYSGLAAEKTEVSFERAQVLFKNNDLANGKDVAEQAIVEDKKRSLASQFHQAGIEYQHEKENDKAILQYSLLLKNYPDYARKADVLLRLGDSYRELGQYVEAQKAYQELLALQPSNKTAAERLMLLNKRKQAEDQLRSLGYVEEKN